MFRVEEDGQFRGTVTFLHLVPSAGCVADAHVNPNAGIKASKLQHQHREVYAQESAQAAAAEARVVHVVKGAAGKVRTIKAGCVTPCVGNATITVDLLKNGASILTATFDLTSSESAYELVAGTIDDDALEDGDVLEVDIAVNAGTGTPGKGVFVYVDLWEDES